jgi:hypothetical protein
MTLRNQAILERSHSAPISTRPIPSQPRRSLTRGVKRLLGFALWVLSGFGLLGFLLRRKSKARMEEIVVYSVPRSFFLWGLVAIGFAGAAIVRHYGADSHAAHVWGWVYVWALLYTIVTLAFDVSTWRFFLWTMIFAFVWLISKYLEDVRDMYLLSGVFAYLRGLKPVLNAGFATVVSWLLLLGWIGGLFHAFGRGRKTFSPNSIEEWYLGEGREILDRSGLKFRSRYRDVLESVLGMGCGDLEAVDGNGNVVKRWESILFLFFVWRRLDEILHQRAATVDSAPGDVIEVHPVAAGAPLNPQ